MSVHGVTPEGDVFAQHDNLHNAKLLVYHPTPQPLVGRMVELLNPAPQELFLDLGSGDGRILVAAAKHGCDRVVGYELKPDLVAKSKKVAKAAGVHVTVNQASFLELSLRTVSCVAVYLDEPILESVMPNLETLRPGARVVSYAHKLPGVPVQDVYAWDEGVLYYYDAPIKRKEVTYASSR
jgi:SAM-dependent methyltransferase